MNIQNKQQEYWEDLIIDRITGSISDEKRAQLSEWLSSDEKNMHLFKEMENAWNLSQLSINDGRFKWNSSFHVFEKRIAENKKTGNIISFHNNIYRKIAIYAAVIIPFVFMGYFTYKYFTLSESTGYAALLSEITVPYGSKTTFKMPDGTVVQLNSGSKMQYNSNYGKKTRTVLLSGEAYFDVVKNKDCPFLVNVGDVKVKVLGTKFNVQAYKEDNMFNVSLLQGSVEMNTTTGSVILKPKDMARYNVSSGKTVVLANATDYAIDWVNDRMTFNGETFDQIVRTLERKYNVQINVHNEHIKNRKFVGDFVNKETIEQILKVMSAGKMFEYKIKGNVIDLY